MKFQKKPVVIEAKQWHAHGDHEKVKPLASTSDVATHIRGAERERLGYIFTMEGGHIVTPGDWIIQGVKGEFYPCKPDIFAATYDPA
jgi:hypothetical protein